MTTSWLSLIPPVVVLGMGFWTRKTILSLFTGVLVAAAIAKNFSPLETISLSGEKFLDTLELSTLLNPATFLEAEKPLICFFLLLLGVFITLIHHSGGAFAYKGLIKSRLSEPRHVEMSSLTLSFCLCIDDYFSSLTVGSVMHPITDTYRIARAKLAFLVDSMAAPLTLLCPVSSWVAAIMGYLRDNGIHNDLGVNTQILGSPFMVYLNVIPFMFYSFILIFGAWYIVWRRISFGKMAIYEDLAQSSPASSEDDHHPNASIYDFLVPVLLLIFGVCSGILLSGGYGQVGVVEALRNAEASIALFGGGVSSIILSIVFLVSRRKLKLKNLPRLTLEGFKLMALPCTVLVFAWTLGSLLRQELGTGDYLAKVLVGRIGPEFLPAMFFLAAAATAFATGTSWGSAAIMFPIGIQLILTLNGDSQPVSWQELPLLTPVLGAILSGCVAGDHISPISDTTIMSAISTKMNHQEHVESQFSYALPLIIITMIGLAIGGGLIPVLGLKLACISALAVSFLLVAIIMSWLNKRWLQKA